MALTPFRRFVAGQTASYLSYHMLGVIIGWQVYDLTRSPMILGFVGLMQFLPQFLLTLAAGHVADRHDRRRVTAACQITGALLSAVLSLGSLAGLMDERCILAAAFLVGAARAFEYPTMQALLPSLVNAGELPRYLALSAGSRQAGVIVGPALGGVLYIAGPGAAYAVCACFSLLAALFILSIRSDRPVFSREPASWRSVFEGLTYIRSKPEILGAISLDLFSVLLGGATALLPVFARDILDTGPWGLGLLRAAPATGAVAMSIYLARRPLKRRVGRTMFRAVAVFGLATMVFGLSRSFVLSLAALAVLGMSDMVSVVVRSSLIQLETPDDKRGRVSAVNAVFIGTSNQLGEFESGLTAAWFGVVPAVVLGGVGTLLVVIAWMRLFPALLRRETLTARRPPLNP
ncbi:MFS transporter [Desulfovibrio aminophilus]|nr:MFS transporter [Desulfovibrio aminophilus]